MSQMDKYHYETGQLEWRDGLRRGDEVAVSSRGHVTITKVGSVTPKQISVLGHGKFWKKNARGVGHSGIVRKATDEDRENIQATLDRNFVVGYRLYDLTAEQYRKLAALFRKFDKSKDPQP
jgi:hypothetical protein